MYDKLVNMEQHWVVLLLLYTRVQVLQWIHQRAEKEKEQNEYGNINACSKAILLFGFTDFYLMHAVNSYTPTWFLGSFPDQINFIMWAGGKNYIILLC